MTTKFIGIKEFRQNMTKLYKSGKKKNVRFIVMNHSEPFLKVELIDEDELIMKVFAKDIEEALAQVKRGEVHTPEEVRRHLKLK